VSRHQYDNPSLFYSQDVTDTKGYDFETFIKKKELMMGLVEKGFEKPSPVQEECLPLALQGKVPPSSH
jgi:ATP-dependent RNA helicase DDX6/DHH1